MYILDQNDVCKYNYVMCIGPDFKVNGIWAKLTECLIVQLDNDV